MTLLTIFTTTYNLAHTLSRTYQSLFQQNCKDFIWLIIDDGSMDNTRELVVKWQEEQKDFKIKYIYKENGGMHTAHNTAYENIDTELNMCIDSDDCLAENAVNNILSTWDKVRNCGYAGIIGLDSDLKGNIIGKAFPIDLKETTLGDYYAKGGKGDKKLVYRTDIIKKYPPYPVFEGEKYVALSFKYLLCDQDYKLAVLNEIVCLVDYQDDGSTATMWKQYRDNPKGFALLRRLDMQYPTSLKKYVYANIHYISCSILSRNFNFFRESPNKIITFLLFPFGLILSRYVIYRANKLEEFK